MLRLIVGLLLLAGLAGCSARGGSPAATGTARPQDVAAIAREWVRCVRANGAQNLPDPQIDSNGRPHFPEGTPQPPDRALRACQPIVDRLPPSARGDDERTRPPADMQLLLGFARCMREHGLTDFPDPRDDGVFLRVGTSARREIYGPAAAPRSSRQRPRPAPPWRHAGSTAASADGLSWILADEPPLGRDVAAAASPGVQGDARPR
jgi:hypothetical protein